MSADGLTDCASTNDARALAGARVVRFAETLLPTVHGALRCVVYRERRGDGRDESAHVEHVAIVGGAVTEAMTCRVHSECLTSEVLGSVKCDCKQQLDAALDVVAREGGVVLYLRQEGRGIGLGNKIRAYALQERGLDTLDANRALGLPDDARDYGVAAAMLRDLGVRSVRLLTNNPLKVTGLERAGVVVDERVPLVPPMSRQAAAYVRAKVARMGHVVDGDALR